MTAEPKQPLVGSRQRQGDALRGTRLPDAKKPRQPSSELGRALDQSDTLVPRFSGLDALDHAFQTPEQERS